VPEPGRRDYRSGGRRDADDGRSSRLPDGLERQTRSAERLRLRELSICSAENLSSATGRRALPAGQRNHCQRSRTAGITLSAAMQVAAEIPEARFRISLEIRDDRVYEPCGPYGRRFLRRSAASDNRARVKHLGLSGAKNSTPGTAPAIVLKKRLVCFGRGGGHRRALACRVGPARGRRPGA
jgi:hypothetical protein